MEDLANQAADAAQGTVESAQQDQGTDNALDLSNTDGETNVDAQTTDEILELESVDRFKWGGEEYTPDQMQEAFLRQADYTKKTQDLSSQRKKLEQLEEFYDNFEVDAEAVKQNPALIDQFKQTYPERFHKKLDRHLNQGSVQGTEQKPDQEYQSQLKQEFQSVKSELDQIKTEAHEREVAASEKYLDSLFTKFSNEYPYADEDAVLVRAEKILEENKRHGTNYRLTDAAFERLFKQDHETRQAKYDQLHQQRMEAQLKESQQASDVGSGGVPPGQAPKQLSLSEVADYAIEDISARNR